MFTLLCTLPISVNTSCAKPPMSVAQSPLVITDGAGGYIFMTAISGREGVAPNVTRVTASGKLGWRMRMETQLGDGRLTTLINDGKTNFYAIWCSGHNVWINKFDIDGRPVWKDKVRVGKSPYLLTQKSISDGNGGVITGYYGKKGDFWLQRINSEGQLLWTSKRWLATVKDFNIALDSEGNTSMIYTTLKHILLNKISPIGKYVWQSPIVLTSATPLATNSSIGVGLLGCSSGNAGYESYETWLFNAGNGITISAYAHKYRVSPLYITETDANGNVLWTKSYLSPDISISMIPYRLCQDNSNGIFCLWRTYSGNFPYVEHVDISGNSLWAIRNGTELLPAKGVRTYDLTIDHEWVITLAYYLGNNDLGINAAYDTSTYTYIQTQQFDSNGLPLWKEEGRTLKVNLLPPGGCIVQSDGMGGFIIMTFGISSYAWRIDAQGNVLWTKQIS